MNTSTRTIVRVALVAFALGLGLSASCEKKKTDSPDDGAKKDDTASKDDGAKKDEGSTLCTEYGTCDECIAGEMAKGKSESAADTECGAAVIGCWTTWKKPVVCHGKEHKEKPKK